MGRSVVVALAVWTASVGCAKAPPAPAARADCPAATPAAAAPAAAAPAVVAPPAAVAGPSPAVAAPAPPAAGGDGVAVVMLMLPGAGEPDAHGRPHAYTVSLAPDTKVATVEVDGQPMGAAPVQHVSPANLERWEPRAAPGAARALPSLSAAPVRAARSRGVPTAVRPRVLPAAAMVPPPNGAPIID